MRGSTRRAHSLAAIVVASVLFPACVSMETANNPTLPAPEWHLYGGRSIGYTVTLPPSWAAFDLMSQVDGAAGACSHDDRSRQARREQLSSLRDRGVRLFACDQSRNADSRLPLAYAVTDESPPPEGLDQYLDKQRQPQGREVLERRHVKTNAGDMVLQKIRERGSGQDGTTLDTMQYQFLVTRFNAFHLFFVEFRTSLQDALGKDAELMGTSFTPVR